MKEDGKEKVDDRFGDLFTDKAFQIDEESERYNQLKPVCKYEYSYFSHLQEFWAKHVLACSCITLASLILLSTI